MSQTVELPIWFFVLIVVFAAITFASHFLFPSVRWFFRRRLERAVARLNRRLERPIEPFRLARRYDMIQRLIYDPAVGQSIADYAKQEGIPENVAFEKAKRYAREIVPSFSAIAYFSFAIRAARLLSNAIYHVRLGYVDEVALAEIDRDATVVFVMNHRSNMDYVLVTYLAADRSALSYAVGEWAQVWPLSRLIRAMGAYFIRRRAGNDLYRSVLATYVRHATKGGVTQAIFPEGGLSLNGHLAAPKLGLLKYMVQGSLSDEKDVVFVPVALNYDRVLEDRILTSAARAGDRRFQARIGIIMLRMSRQLWLWLTRRYYRFGTAAVTFGQPLSLAQFRRDTVQQLTDSQGEAVERGEQFTRRLAQDLMQRIGDAVPVLPVPLVSWLLMKYGPQSRAELRCHIAQFAVSTPHAEIHMPVQTYDAVLDDALWQLMRRGIVCEEAGRVCPVDKYIELLVFYANSVDHLQEK